MTTVRMPKQRRREPIDPKALIDSAKRLWRDILRGEDIIEAMNGHYCDEQCWHYVLGDETMRALIRDRVTRRKP